MRITPFLPGFAPNTSPASAQANEPAPPSAPVSSPTADPAALLLAENRNDWWSLLDPRDWPPEGPTEARILSRYRAADDDTPSSGPASPGHGWIPSSGSTCG